MAKKTPEEIEREVERICREIKYEGFINVWITYRN